jgi:NADPH:quinone reductase-like Zn-dependent oxidoreductase
VRTVTYSRYEPPEVLELREVPQPEPREGEILVRVRATTVTARDQRMRAADPFAARIYTGLFAPRPVRVLGFEVTGDVEGTGRGTTRFQGDDPVQGRGRRFRLVRIRLRRLRRVQAAAAGRRRSPQVGQVELPGGYPDPHRRAGGTALPQRRRAGPSRAESTDRRRSRQRRNLRRADCQTSRR